MTKYYFKHEPYDMIYYLKKKRQNFPVGYVFQVDEARLFVSAVELMEEIENLVKTEELSGKTKKRLEKLLHKCKVRRK